MSCPRRETRLFLETHPFDRLLRFRVLETQLISHLAAQRSGSVRVCDNNEDVSPLCVHTYDTAQTLTALLELAALGIVDHLQRRFAHFQLCAHSRGVKFILMTALSIAALAEGLTSNPAADQKNS